MDQHSRCYARKSMFVVVKYKRLYAADWGIAYDLQRAEQLIEREIRMTEGKDLSRVDSQPLVAHGDLPRPTTGPCERCLRAESILRDIVNQWEGAEWCADAVKFLADTK